MAARLCTDILMVMLFLLLMADRHTGNPLHECLGLVLAGVFLLHTWLNRGWYMTLGKGRYDKARVIRFILNLLLLASLLCTLGSAVLISRTVFSFADIRGELFFRTIHVSSAHWCLLLSALHLGLYGKRFCTMLGRLVSLPHLHRYGRAGSIFGIILVAYGAYAFSYRELIYPLTMRSAFMPWSENVVLFFLDYGAIFFMCTWSAYMLSSLVHKRNVLAPVLEGMKCPSGFCSTATQKIRIDE